MTVIVWDGTTLAADRLAVSQSHVFSITKIARIGGLLVGVAGTGSKIREFQDWLGSPRAPERYPRHDNEHHYFTAIVIGREGFIHRYESSPVPMVVEDPVHVIGVGRDFARAALHCGKTAKEAVEITNLYSADCGGGVDTLTFEDPE